MVCSTGGTLHLIVPHTLPATSAHTLTDTHECGTHNIHFHSDIVQMWQWWWAPAASFFYFNSHTHTQRFLHLDFYHSESLALLSCGRWSWAPPINSASTLEWVFLQLVVAVCFFSLDANFAACMWIWMCCDDKEAGLKRLTESWYTISFSLVEDNVEGAWKWKLNWKNKRTNDRLFSSRKTNPRYCEIHSFKTHTEPVWTTCDHILLVVRREMWPGPHMDGWDRLLALHNIPTHTFPLLNNDVNLREVILTT